jgi:hypothetical protein
MDKPHRDAVAAIEHCRPNLDELIYARKPKVIVPMGNVALRRVCGVSGIEERAGYVLPTPYGIPAVPTYHPAYIQRGKQNLVPVVLWALQRAGQIADGSFTPSVYSLLVDAPPESVRDYLASSGSHIPSLFVDIETPESAALDEEDLEEDGPSYTIVRAGFSVRAGTACSFPWEQPYIDIMREALSRAEEVVEWADHHFDTRRLAAAGLAMPARIVSAMWAWHWLQSDLRKGLGLVAPFFYAGPPWKHLSAAEPGRYNALDNAIGFDCYSGTRAALQSQGRWDAFNRHCVDFAPVLQAMGRKGLRIDRAYQTAFMAQLETEWDVSNTKLQTFVPDAIKPRKQWKRPPKDLTGVTELPVPSPEQQMILTGAADKLGELLADLSAPGAGRSSSYPDDSLHITESAHKRLTVTPYRYERIEPFNPDSWPQVTALAKHLGIKLPPRESAKESDEEALATDKKTLGKYAKKYPAIACILKCRERWKLISTYKWKLDADDRVHYVLGYHPSTWRLCIAEGTPVEIARNLRTNPDAPPIEKVKPGDWAYTYDNAGRLTVRKVAWVKKTGIRKVVRVHWEAGYGPTMRQGYTDMTPDHLVRLADGSWKEAQRLTPYNKGTWKHRGYPKGGKGDSLTAMKRGVTTALGYSILHTTGRREAVRDNRVVYEGATGKYAEHVHHIDGDKLNNLPDNLQGLDRDEHGHLTGSERWAREVTTAKRVGPMQAQARKELREHLERTKYPKPVPYCRYVPNNHRVMRVEKLDTPVPVYDLEVEETHNFIAGEICVHNSCRNANLQTIPKRSDLARLFRRMIVATPGHKLIEGDSAAIEAVLVGYFAGSARYRRLAKCGVHGWLTAKLHGLEIPLTLEDSELQRQSKLSKKQWPEDYEKMKRVVHLSNYLGTKRRIHEEYPDDFPTEREAAKLQQFYLGSDPGQDVRAWQKATVELAHASKALENNFGLRHRFYSLYAWNARRSTWEFGDDAKRAVAFRPQSAAAAIQRIIVQRLLERMPQALQWLCLLVHDSIIADVPDAHVDEYCTALYEAMTSPIDELEGLTIGAEMLMGDNAAPADQDNEKGMREWLPR